MKEQKQDAAIKALQLLFFSHFLYDLNVTESDAFCRLFANQ
jgi:hypothetical protein